MRSTFASGIAGTKPFSAVRSWARTCSCSYQNQTSLALIHMPEMEMWTYSQFGIDGEQGDRILRAGINFGAPGNRRAPDGTLWLEHPHAGTGNSPRLGIEGLPESTEFFRRHSSQVSVDDGALSPCADDARMIPPPGDSVLGLGELEELLLEKGRPSRQLARIGITSGGLDRLRRG